MVRTKIFCNKKLEKMIRNILDVYRSKDIFAKRRFFMADTSLFHFPYGQLYKMSFCAVRGVV
jgi:hypothetical protein